MYCCKPAYMAVLALCAWWTPELLFPPAVPCFLLTSTTFSYAP